MEAKERKLERAEAAIKWCYTKPISEECQHRTQYELESSKSNPGELGWS